MDKIKTGDIVNLKIKKKIFKIKGEVLDIYFNNNIQYITIYSFFKRKPETFILNENSELIEINKNSLNIDDQNSPVIYELTDEEKKHDNKFLFKAISFLTLIIFTFSIFDDIKYPFFIPKFGYETFLKKNYNLKELYLTVRKRLDYAYDLGDDYWQTPEDAWKNKKGDCEEFASIIADYLTMHKINNYLVGMNTRDNKGHAVVFSVINNVFYIIDPTRAIELDGVAKLNKIKSLDDAVRLYTRDRAFIYSVPKFNGDKNITDKVN